jgi:dinuclear metal center YbgI/SA1388 family protein
MAISLHELVAATDRLLDSAAFADYCPNGLQLEASAQVSRIITGVTACEALIDEAIRDGADALLVHHGYFWKGESLPLVGVKARRIAKLFRNNISLLAYHLPLDAHPQLGNNVQLARVLGLQITGNLRDEVRPIGLVGELLQPMRAGEWVAHVGRSLGREPLWIGDQQRVIRRVAWCSGAAQSAIEAAALRQVDCFLTGEVSESTFHLATELGIGFMAAGHHATERYGIEALGNHLAKALGISCRFVDINNPV